MVPGCRRKVYGVVGLCGVSRHKTVGYYRLDRHDRDDGAYNNMCDYRGDGNTCGGCGNDSNKPGGPLTRDFSLQL